MNGALQAVEKIVLGFFALVVIRDLVRTPPFWLVLSQVVERIETLEIFRVLRASFRPLPPPSQE
ncbi:MAG: hypothetical protein JWN86_3070 [Planctomycetota bacterium]|nr:hypothetical protein [Planctomycetota bacterium]